MQYNETGIICDAEESDWLDVSYTERKFVNTKKNKRASKSGDHATKRGKAWKIAVVAVLCVAVLATTLLLDGDFKKDVFEAVKTATASIFNKREEVTNKIDIPCNLTLVDVSDGVMTFNGGRAVLALLGGKVTKVSEDSVTVEVDEKTSIVYSGITSVMAKLNDEVAEGALLGKYEGQFTASILQQGEVVKQVVGSETQLTWNV